MLVMRRALENVMAEAAGRVATITLNRPRIRYGERRDVALKGKVGLSPVCPARGIREAFGERWEGYETPLVGRDREMVQLLDIWNRAQGGEGGLVTVVGDAGVGKSRLLAELVGTITASSAVRVLRARSLSYGQEISLWLVGDFIRSFFGVKGQDTLMVVAAKLRGGIPPLLPTVETATAALEVLGEVLGLPRGDSAVARAGVQIRRHALTRGLGAVLGALGERAGKVVVLGDLHWTDNPGRDVLAEILADVLGLRLLVLAAQRPGWIAPWGEWGWPERLTLRPLGEQEAALLGGAVAGRVPLAGGLERHVAERAGGNPFFVEEMLRSLLETGGITERGGEMYLVPGGTEKLPSTLTEVLLARLDRLDAAVRSVAQVASVIGRSFAVTLLSEVVGQAVEVLEEPLGQLQRAEIAFPRRTPALEYVFKHVSMRDVAYNTLIHRRRQELHLQTARAIAAVYPSDEYMEMIAYHYARTEAPEAAEWLEKAGDRASAVYANDEALEHYREAARRFVQQGSEQTGLARLEEKLGTVLSTAGRYDEALEHLGRRITEALSRVDIHRFGPLTGTGQVTEPPTGGEHAAAGEARHHVLPDVTSDHGRHGPLETGQTAEAEKKGKANKREAELAWNVRSLLMSCRVFGREIEEAFFAEIMKKAQADGVSGISVMFKETEKNAPAKAFMKKHFKGASSSGHAESAGGTKPVPKHPKEIYSPFWVKTTVYGKV